MAGQVVSCCCCQKGVSSLDKFDPFSSDSAVPSTTMAKAEAWLGMMNYDGGEEDPLMRGAGRSSSSSGGESLGEERDLDLDLVDDDGTVGLFVDQFNPFNPGIQASVGGTGSVRMIPLSGPLTGMGQTGAGDRASDARRRGEVQGNAAGNNAPRGVGMALTEL